MAAIASPCPDLAELALPLSAAVREHVASCPSCKLVTDAIAEGDSDTDDDCARFDALLAARSDGTLNRAGANLLDRHLASCSTCRAVFETLAPPGDVFGDHADLPRVDPDFYALGLEVARGGMGRIIAARDLRVGRPIAIKELLGKQPQLAARFEREARVTARLQHPGIVPIYEIGRWPDGTPFYSMRMVDGRTLRAALDTAQTLAHRLTHLPAVIAACEAVAFAHGQRVIHRDLTPANVLVGQYGETVVIDWGLAKDLSDGEPEPDLRTTGPELLRAEAADPPVVTGRAESPPMTNVGAVVGTLAYMPPEQARAEPVDERADVYALGAILYHLLAGTPPYRAATPDELLALVKAGDPPPPLEAIAPQAPRDLISIVTKAMARAPDARYPTARELAEELKRFQAGRMVEAHQYSRRERVRRFIARNQGAVITSALAVAALVAIGIIAVRNVVQSREAARAQARELVLEKGRLELLGGDSQRALAYLYDAKVDGASGRSIDFLLGSALSDVASSQRILDCQGDPRFAEFSPDGKQLAVSCHERAVIWQFADGRPIATLTGRGRALTGAFDSLRYSHDGTKLVTFGNEGTARVWSTRDGTLLRELPHGTRITFATFTPDDQRIATSGHDGLAHIWDVATGARLRTIDGRQGVNPLIPRLYAVLTPDGKRLVGLTFDGTGRGWDVDSGQLLGGFHHGHLLAGGILSPDGKRALTCDLTGVAKLWDTETIDIDHNLDRPPLRVLGGHTDVAWKCMFSRDSKLALTTSQDGTAKVWDVSSGQLVTQIDHGDVIWLGNFAPDGRRFVTVGIGGAAIVWDTASGARLASHDTHNGKDAIFSPDGKNLIVLRGDERIEIWGLPSRRRGSFELAGASFAAVTSDGMHVVVDTETLQISHIADGKRDHERLVAPTVAGRRIVVAMIPLADNRSRELAVVDAATGATLHKFAIGGEPSELKLADDDRHLLVAMRGSAPPEVWDVEHAQRLLVLRDATNGMLSHDGARALAWTDNAPPVVWDVNHGTPIATLAVTGDYTPIGFADGGDRVALRERERDPGLETPHTVSLWDATGGAAIARLRDTNGYPTLDRSGRFLTVIGANRILTVRSTSDGSVRYSFQSEFAREAQVSPDGDLVAAIDDHNRSVLILDRTGALLARWPIAHPDVRVTLDTLRTPIATAAWTPDGSSVITQSSNVDVWNIANPYSDNEIVALMRKHVPWRLVEGRLELVQNGQLAGRIVRAGKPIAAARVRIEIRRPANLGTAIDWDSMKAKVSTRVIETGSDGEFELDNLVPGDYSLTISDGSDRSREETTVVSVTAEDEPVTIDLAH